MNITKTQKNIVIAFNNGEIVILDDIQLYDEIIKDTEKNIQEKYVTKKLTKQIEENAYKQKIIKEAKESGFFLHKKNKFYIKEVSDKIALPTVLVEMIIEKKEIKKYTLLWKRLLYNPGKYVKENLCQHIKYKKIEINENGLLILYRNLVTKGKEIYTDMYTKTFNIIMGYEVAVDRKLCNTNKFSCGEGLHLATKDYESFKAFGDVTCVALVAPEDILYFDEKIRCTRYLPIKIIEDFEDTKEAKNKNLPIKMKVIYVEAIKNDTFEMKKVQLRPEINITTYEKKRKPIHTK